MKIRLAKLKDENYILNLNMALYESGKSFDPLLKKIRENDAKRWIRKKLRDRKARTYVAIDKTKMVGYCLGVIEKRPYFFKVSQVGYIWECFVINRYRRMGVGKALINEIFSWFGLKGIKNLETDVYSKNKDAIQFWKSFGFREIRKKMRVKLH